MNNKKFWESVYEEKSANQLTWTQDTHEPSLEWIKGAVPNRSAVIIDVGGGISSLTHRLADDGYKNLTILDISSAALEMNKSNFKGDPSTVKWIESDITSFRSENSFHVWHDRAVFHFLTYPNDRTAYLESVRRNLKVGGSVIIGTFSLTWTQPM